ncbi:glycosyl hydrolase [Dictyobacter alpinus]|uniref:Glycosyl hydrolase n=1 Tax=Dictyobacter alpinus TaxID=2014873 RepID=A0A402B742_9CHLR|nr:glycosyltransferase family 2 protein [Dictyobacter alpinus]GCE27139.1 glycosyl hydrolase [Dictyobacter alpinus]
MLSFEQVSTIISQAIPFFSGIILLILLINLFILLLNLATFVRLRSQDVADDNDQVPLVSVLIPARNEEANIEACIRSLLQQQYGNLEIIVLDDQSSDQTAAIVKHLITKLPDQQSPILRLIQGKPLPEDWIGKNFACQQLAKQAGGKYILFTDADTIHQPGMVRAMIQHMQKLQVQLLSAQPEQIQRSLGEQLIVPLLNFTILTLLPIPLIRLRREPSLATGNGQLLCFERSAYQAIGGHSTVKGKILEDVLLARTMKAAGYRMAYADAFELTQCRMYHSFAEVWSGFSKNLFAFYNYSLPFALVALVLNLLLFVVPPFLLLACAVHGSSAGTILPVLTITLLPLIMRMLLALRFTRSNKGWVVILGLLHPISIILECVILLNSIRWHYRKSGAVWKGRYYPA